jgi:hypothetical protein
VPEQEQEQPRRGRRWPWIAGIVAALLVGVGIGAGGQTSDDGASEDDLATAEEDHDQAQRDLDKTQSALDEAEAERDEATARAGVLEDELAAVEEAARTTTTTEAPTTTTTAPPTTAPPENPEVTNARRSAESYLDFSGFSRSGLIDQLEFEGYPTEAATQAVDSLNVDWNEQAARSAESYLEYTAFSHAGLVDQLEFEGFTPEQAEHGATVAMGG